MLFVDKNDHIELKGDALSIVVEFRLLVEAMYETLREHFGEKTATRVLDETYRNGKADADAGQQPAT